MNELLGSAIGVVIGVSVICLRNRIASVLEKAYTKFPGYGEGIRAFNVRFAVRPAFIVVLGIIIVIMSMITLFGTF